MTLSLASCGSFDALLADGWRIPREMVAPATEAQALLAEAGRRAAAVHEACEGALAAARAKGFQQGLSEGRADAQREAADKVAELFGALSGLRTELQAELGRLALTIVRRLAGELGEAALLQRIVQEVVRQALADQPIALRAPPEAAEQLRGWSAAALPEIPVLADDSLEAGTVVIETRNGALRAGLPLQLRALESAFRAVQVGEPAS